MLRIEQTYKIKATPDQVWKALTDSKLQTKWTGGQAAQYDARVGGTYTLFGDYVTGTIVTCDPTTKLAQTWKPSDWTIEDSLVTFTLTKIRGGTQVDLVHENVQPEDFDGTGKGWDEFYVGAIKKMLEKGKPKAKAKAKGVKKGGAKKTVAKKKVTVKKKKS